MLSSLSRRNVLKLGAGATGAGVVAVGTYSQLMAANRKNPAPGKDDLTPDQALRSPRGNQPSVTNKRKNPHS